MNRASVVLTVTLLLISACALPASSFSPPASAEASPPPVRAIDGGWQRLDLPNANSATLLGIAATAHDVVIVGGRDTRPAAWASHDSGPWTFELLKPEGAFAGEAIALDDRIVAVGGIQTNRCPHPAATVAWVRAADGRWADAPFDQLFCAGNQASYAAAVAGRAAILGTGTGDQPFAWFSDDGLKWVDAGIQPGVFPRILAPAVAGFAAFGTIEDRWWFGRTDGRARWTIAPFGDLPPETSVLGLADEGGRFIAWFSDSAGKLMVFTSEGGDGWRTTNIVQPPGVMILRVLAVRDGYVALGSHVDPPGPRLFVSRDGLAWRALVGPADAGPATYDSLAFSGDRVILLGSIAVGDQGTTVGWAGRAFIFEP